MFDAAAHFIVTLPAFVTRNEFASDTVIKKESDAFLYLLHWQFFGVAGMHVVYVDVPELRCWHAAVKKFPKGQPCEQGAAAVWLQHSAAPSAGTAAQRRARGITLRCTAAAPAAGEGHIVLEVLVPVSRPSAVEAWTVDSKHHFQGGIPVVSLPHRLPRGIASDSRWWGDFEQRAANGCSPTLLRVRITLPAAAYDGQHVQHPVALRVRWWTAKRDVDDQCTRALRCLETASHHVNLAAYWRQVISDFRREHSY